MAIVRANRLIVPLTGVHVYGFGAATSNLNPESWQTIKAFGIGYHRAAGAQLEVYSPEVVVFRRYRSRRTGVCPRVCPNGVQESSFRSQREPTSQ